MRFANKTLANSLTFIDFSFLQLSNVYESVNDIDLYSGAIAEKAVRGGAVGPTFACLIGEQFDRY